MAPASMPALQKPLDSMDGGEGRLAKQPTDEHFKVQQAVPNGTAWGVRPDCLRQPGHTPEFVERVY
jgi:hypothetical protein